MRSRGIKVLYIASPIDDWDFVENVKKSVHSENLVITGKDLEGNCFKDIKLKFQIHLFFNLREHASSIFKLLLTKYMLDVQKWKIFMTIYHSLNKKFVFEGKLFYASVGSSWSLNIMLERIAAGKMGNIHNTNLLQEIKVHNRSPL